jgi:small subunit ribosomal protein S3
LSGSAGTPSKTPPNQKYIKEFIFYGALGVPEVDISSYKLLITGLVDRPLEFAYDQLKALPQVTVAKPTHCVTGWSVADTVWKGPSLPALLKEDELIRTYLRTRLQHAAISDVHIERKPGKVLVTVHTGRPGVVIGKRGAEVDKLRDELAQLTSKEIGINVEEIKRPELDAQLVADNVAHQLAQRISFRRAMKRAVQSAMRMGAQGIKIKCGGRLGGAEIARVEGYHEGRVPLHTLRADVDYATSTAKTTFGTIGVKTWIFKGEVVEDARGRTYSTGA